MGATPRGQPWTPAVTLPHVRDGLSVLWMAVLCPFWLFLPNPRRCKIHIPSILVVKPRRLPHPLEMMKALVHLGSAAAPTIWPEDDPCEPGGEEIQKAFLH